MGGCWSAYQQAMDFAGYVGLRLMCGLKAATIAVSGVPLRETSGHACWSSRMLGRLVSALAACGNVRLSSSPYGRFDVLSSLVKLLLRQM